jgi:hypothetical protein
MKTSKRAGSIQIPLSERDTLAGLLKVKPTAQMPRPGAQATKKKAKKTDAKRAT